MAPVKAGRFNAGSMPQLAAALGIRPTGAYAFVAYANQPLDIGNLQARGFKLEQISSQSGVDQYRSTNWISTRQRGPRPRDSEVWSQASSSASIMTRNFTSQV
jgi:hypothetical protein